jgi:hypothetical protein
MNLTNQSIYYINAFNLGMCLPGILFFDLAGKLILIFSAGLSALIIWQKYDAENRISIDAQAKN